MQMLCLLAAPHATEECVRSFGGTDFRQDVQRIQVPTLIIHGTSDDIVPVEASGDQLAKMLPQATYIKYDGAPHGLFITEKDRLSRDLLDFVGAGTAQSSPATTSAR